MGNRYRNLKFIIKYKTPSDRAVSFISCVVIFLPIAYCLPKVRDAYCLLPIAYCLPKVRDAYRLVPNAYCLPKVRDAYCSNTKFC